MKLTRFMRKGEARLGAAQGKEVVDLSAAARHYFQRAEKAPYLEGLVQAALSDSRAFLAAGSAVHEVVAEAVELAGDDNVAGDLDSLVVLPFVANPDKVLGLGYNYRALCDHENVPYSATPQLFVKMSSSVIGANEAVVVPPRFDKVDFEAELTAVIGRTTTQVSVEDALSYVGGYTVMNELTAKIVPRPKTEAETVALVLKGADTFAPVGNIVQTADELTDISDRHIICRVNGEERQRFPVNDWVHDVAQTIAFASSFMTLYPGDMIAMGTSLGIGIIERPPRFLQDGDVVECELEGVARTRNVIRYTGS